MCICSFTSKQLCEENNKCSSALWPTSLLSIVHIITIHDPNFNVEGRLFLIKQAQELNGRHYWESVVAPPPSILKYLNKYRLLWHYVYGHKMISLLLLCFSLDFFNRIKNWIKIWAQTFLQMNNVAPRMNHTEFGDSLTFSFTLTCGLHLCEWEVLTTVQFKKSVSLDIQDLHVRSPLICDAQFWLKMLNKHVFISLCIVLGWIKNIK